MTISILRDATPSLADILREASGRGTSRISPEDVYFVVGCEHEDAFRYAHTAYAPRRVTAPDGAVVIVISPRTSDDLSYRFDWDGIQDGD